MSKETGHIREPSEDEKAQGTYFGLWIDAGPGMPSAIFSSASKAPLWHCKQNRWYPWRFPVGLFKKSELVFTDPEQAEVLRICRTKSFVAGFEILQGDRQVGTVSYHSAWRTRCTIDLMEGGLWEVRQPLFTIYFWGESNAGELLCIRVGPSKRQWNLLVPASGANIRLLAALALMHREYWTH